MTPAIPDSRALRILIRDRSLTKSGFTRQDASHLAIHQSLVSTRCAIMIKAGVLFRGEARGQALHYFSSEAAARSWEASIPPYVKQRKKIGVPATGRKQTAASRLLVEVILQKAATPEGFTASDRPDCIRRTSVWQRCAGMLANGELFVTSMERGVSCYFISQAGADACRQAYLERSGAKAQAALKERKRIEANAAMRAIPRKPYAPPVKVAAIIVYPDDYRHTVIPTPAPRFNPVERPAFMHGGMGQMR